MRATGPHRFAVSSSHERDVARRARGRHLRRDPLGGGAVVRAGVRGRVARVRRAPGDDPRHGRLCRHRRRRRLRAHAHEPHHRATARRPARLRASHEEARRRHLRRSRGEARAEPAASRAPDDEQRLLSAASRSDREAARRPRGPHRRPEEGRRRHEPARRAPGPRGDLRLAPAGRATHPAAQPRPRGELRRLQPRHPLRAPDDGGRRPGACDRRGRAGPRAVRGRQRRGAAPLASSRGAVPVGTSPLPGPGTRKAPFFTSALSW